MTGNFKVPEVIPYHAQWDVTSGCNHRCTFCLTSSGNISPNELSTEEALALIDRLYDEGIWFLKIMGGEPFFRKDILRLFTYAAEKGMVLSFSTNASLITETVAAKLAQIRHSILYAQMSLYGENPVTYQRVTGSADNFERALQGLSRLIEAVGEVSVLTVVTSENVTNLGQFYEIVRQAGAKEFRLVPEIALGRSANRAESDGEQARRVWPVFLDTLARLKADVKADDPVILLDARPMFASYLNKLTGFRTFYENCTAATTMIYITPTGEALPCPFLQHAPDDLMRRYSHIMPGDLRRSSFQEVWNSESFEVFRSYYDPEHNLFKINTACPHFQSGKCIPCAVTPCNCLEMIQLVKGELGSGDLRSQSVVVPGREMGEQL